MKARTYAGAALELESAAAQPGPWRSLPHGAWVEAEAEAHEAKAEALELAARNLEGVLGILSPLGQAPLVVAMQALEAERAQHERAATLARGRGA